MGNAESKLDFLQSDLTVIMLVGLQGAGKTTMAWKTWHLHLKRKIKNHY